MYFDFDDRYVDIEPVGSAINRRDGIALAILVHLVVLFAMVFLPRYLPTRLQAATAVPPTDDKTFVFVQPKLDLKALKAPERAQSSDADRVARSVERPPQPTNTLPYSRGNSAERTETSPEERMRGQGPSPEPAPESQSEDVQQPQLRDDPRMAMMRRPQMQPRAGGSLGEALKNLQKYVQDQSFDNRSGQTQEFGPAIQFDTKGVEFGPWIRRFVSQVRRNWFVPMAAMSMRGRVVITFYVHRNGAITDITVIRPSEIESFNTSAVNALHASSPTEPLPAEYPDDQAFFTVTFFYNETPPGQ